ncbi:MAG: hypothetical protein H6593_04870 [Flavobacteriales bacterium]|nr:hypothetical protein [Flavobacteriales bacterium]
MSKRAALILLSLGVVGLVVLYVLFNGRPTQGEQYELQRFDAGRLHGWDPLAIDQLPSSAVAFSLIPAHGDSVIVAYDHTGMPLAVLVKCGSPEVGLEPASLGPKADAIKVKRGMHPGLVELGQGYRLGHFHVEPELLSKSVIRSDGILDNASMNAGKGISFRGELVSVALAPEQRMWLGAPEKVQFTVKLASSSASILVIQFSREH